MLHAIELKSALSLFIASSWSLIRSNKLSVGLKASKIRLSLRMRCCRACNVCYLSAISELREASTVKKIVVTS